MYNSQKKHPISRTFAINSESISKNSSSYQLKDDSRSNNSYVKDNNQQN